MKKWTDRFKPHKPFLKLVKEMENDKKTNTNATEVPIGVLPVVNTKKTNRKPN